MFVLIEKFKIFEVCFLVLEVFNEIITELKVTSNLIYCVNQLLSSRFDFSC